MESPELGNVISAVSVLFGVLTYFLTMVYEHVGALVARSIPAAEQKEARKKFRRELCRSLTFAEFPVFLSFLLLFYINLPTVFHIAETNRFSAWRFNLIPSLFVFLELGIGICCLISLWLVCRVVLKYWRARK
jgi:hypothetical protein